MARRIGLFVDGNNAFYMQKDLGWMIDWRRFRSYFDKGPEAQICECYFFTGMPEYSETDQVRRQRAFNNSLTDMGYTVIAKELKVVGQDSNGRQIRKANLDIELTLRAVQCLNSCDDFVLVEGDGDFAPLVDYLRQNHKTVVIVSTKKRLARELKNAATSHIDPKGLRQHICRDTRKAKT